MCDQPDIPTAAAPMFAIKKAKMAQDVLDKKAIAADTAAYALRFLQTKKQKQVHATSLTHL